MDEGVPCLRRSKDFISTFAPRNTGTNKNDSGEEQMNTCKVNKKRSIDKHTLIDLQTIKNAITVRKQGLTY